MKIYTIEEITYITHFGVKQGGRDEWKAIILQYCMLGMETWLINLGFTEENNFIAHHLHNLALAGWPVKQTMENYQADAKALGKPMPDNELPIIPEGPTPPDSSEGRPSHLPVYPAYPDQGLPVFPSDGEGNYPDQGLPEGGYPPVVDNTLPGAPKPDQDLPGRKPRPDQGLPPSPGHPGNALPGVGYPDQGLPEAPENALPGTPGRPNQDLPEGPPNKPPDFGKPPDVKPPDVKPPLGGVKPPEVARPKK